MCVVSFGRKMEKEMIGERSIQRNDQREIQSGRETERETITEKDDQREKRSEREAIGEKRLEREKKKLEREKIRERIDQREKRSVRESIGEKKVRREKRRFTEWQIGTSWRSDNVVDSPAAVTITAALLGSSSRHGGGIEICTGIHNCPDSSYAH